MKKGRILRTKLATIAMLLSVGASTFVAPVASLAEVTTQSTTESVKESTVDSSSKEENKNKKNTEESKSQTNNSVEEKVTTEEKTVESQPVERVANQALTSDQIQQLAEREGAAKYNTAGLSNEEIEQLGLAIFGEYQPAGASVTMKNDNGEEVNIPFKMKAMTRAIASSNSFNMNYVLTGHGTTSRYPIMNHHYIGSRYAYCIDPNVLFGNGSDYTSKPMDISNQTYKNINDVMNFGAKDASDDVASGYTQLLVWSRLGWDVTEVGGIGNLEGFKAYQADVESKMQQWYRPASFDGQTINLKVGESTVLIDNNNSIDLMNVTANNTGVEVTKEGNKLTLKATSDSVKSGNVKLRKTSPLAETALIWSSPNEQTVATAGNLDPSSTDTNVKVNIIKEGKLTLKKIDENGKAIAGAKFNITPTLPDGKKQATKVYTTDAKGNFETPVYEEGTKIDYEEIATIAGHYIDPATSKGTIVIKDGGNELVVKNPTVKVALDSQASNVDGAQFVNPLKDQKLRDEVMIDGQQLPENAQLRLTTDYVEFGTGKQLGEESLKKTEEFTAKQAKFVHNVYYDFNAEGMNGKKGVFTNELEYYNPSIKEWEKVASHSDLNNEAESIQFVEPKIHTEFFAFDNNNNAVKNPDPLEKVSGYDRVYYENLISGQPYQFDLSIMDKETEKPFTDPLGKEVTGTLNIAAGKDGEVTSKILAKDYYTAAKESKDNADTEKDTDKADKETANSGSKVEAKTLEATTTDKDTTETDDTATKEENDTATEFSKLKEVTLLTGYVDVPFKNLDLSQAAGKVLVAYESLSSKGTELTSEKNIDEVKQQLTVNVPTTPVKSSTTTRSIPQTWGSLSDMQKVLAAVVMLAIVGAIATVLYLNRKKEVKE
ncbi:VaFE repeat-containing surface-anchored protein [Enterococcus alishanensis]